MNTERDDFYDKTYRALFTHPQMVEELLKDFVKESWIDELDFSTLEKVGTTYTSKYFSKYLQGRTTDVVYKIRYGDNELYIYILIEFQSTVDRFMALRVLTYIALFYQDLIKQGKVKDKLPYIFPLVLYNGDARWTAPLQITDLIETYAKDQRKYHLNFCYHLVSVNSLDRKHLAELKNAVNTLFYIESSSGEEFERNIEQIGEAIFSLSDTTLQEELYRYLVRFLDRKGFRKVPLHKIKAPEVKTMLRTSMEEYKKKLQDKARQEGKQEGKQEGREEGRKEASIKEKQKIATKMIKKNYNIKDIADITGLTIQEIKNIQTQL